LPAQQPANRSKIISAADEARQRGRETMHSSRSGICHRPVHPRTLNPPRNLVQAPAQR
jgi:hypothetical protein